METAEIEVMPPEIYIGLPPKDQLAWRIKAINDAAFIIHVVADRYKVTPEEVMSRSREGKFMMPRHVAMYFMCEMTTMSLKNIGKMFSGRDHTTVISGRDSIKDKTDVYPEIRAEVEAIRLHLRELFQMGKN